MVKYSYFLKGVKEGIFTVIHMKKKWAYLFHTLFIWVMYLLMFYVAIFALDETAHISVGTALTAFIVGGFTIAFTNGGFGSYPFFIAEVLLLFGVTLTVGTAFGLDRLDIPIFYDIGVRGGVVYPTSCIK